MHLTLLAVVTTNLPDDLPARPVPFGAQRTWRPTSVTESLEFYAKAWHYEVHTTGPIITKTGKDHATQTTRERYHDAPPAWLTPHLVGPADMRARLGAAADTPMLGYQVGTAATEG